MENWFKKPDSILDLIKIIGRHLRHLLTQYVVSEVDNDAEASECGVVRFGAGARACGTATSHMSLGCATLKRNGAIKSAVPFNFNKRRCDKPVVISSVLFNSLNVLALLASGLALVSEHGVECPHDSC